MFYIHLQCRISIDVKTEISVLMIYRASMFTVSAYWPDDGSILEPKLAARKTFTNSLLCVIDN